MSVLASSPVSAALKVGDPAPELAVGEWVQGDPVKKFEGDKVYIVEFWATWCGPCVQSIPHLNEIHQRHQDKGLVVIGQNVMERNPAGVKPFVQKMGAKMTYRVALDDMSGNDEGKMALGWMEAANQQGIPCAFVVDKKGKIAYIGHPMALKEAKIEALLAEASTAPGAAVPAGDTSVAPTPKALELAKQARAQLAAGNTDEAEATIATLHENLSDNFRHLGGLFELDLMLARGQTDDAIQLAEVLAEDFGTKRMVVAAVAGHLIAGPKPADKLLATAEKLAAPASINSGHGQSLALAVLARIAFLRGDTGTAIQFQTKAVETATPDAAARAKADLTSYQDGKLPALILPEIP